MDRKRHWMNAIVVFGVGSPRVCLAQAGDLEADLAKLKIRQTTEHYQLAGTVSDERMTEYGRCLEFIYKEYAKGFADLMKDEARERAKSGKRGEPARPRADETTRGSKDGAKAPEDPSDPAAETRFKVIIFAKDEEYNAFGAAYLGGSEHTNGMYIDAHELLLIRDDPDRRETFEVLFHEAFHQFIRRHVENPPMWLNEGLATYYGTASPAKGGRGLVFDRPRSGAFDLVRRAAGERKLIPLDELMTANRSKFYSGERLDVEGAELSKIQLYYAQSYSLIAYIVSDEGGRKHLRQYIRDLAAAKTEKEAAEVTRKAFTKKLLDDMTPRWMALVNKH